MLRSANVIAFFRDIPGTFARGFGLAFERAHGLVRGGNEAIEGLPRLLDAFLLAKARISGGTSKRSLAAMITSCKSA